MQVEEGGLVKISPLDNELDWRLIHGDGPVAFEKLPLRCKFCGAFYNRYLSWEGASSWCCALCCNS
jgi:hypothetical protein